MAKFPRPMPDASAALDLLRLRPYGDSLLTPAVAAWIRFAWIVIFLMASLEGVVWGLVGATMVPRDAIWLSPFSGLFMFALMFTIIWIVDASLVMSERPVLGSRRWNSGANQGIGALLRWILGIGVRLAIVAISLYITAPFLEKLIRADDIAAYHQRQVERYFAQRDQRFQDQLLQRGAQLEQGFRQRADPLRAEIERATESLARDRQRRTEIEAEYAPELEILRKDVAGARQRVGNEILGRDGRPSGRGPEARKWEANAGTLEQQLAAKQGELERRVADVARRIGEAEETLRTRTEQLRELSQTHQQRIDQIAAEVKAEQVEASPPKLSFAARSTALKALRDSPEERSVPHFETVEGFSQAALGVLFFSLIALKLFEPGAVRAYFSETTQAQYQKYLEGGLDDIPGFELVPDPEHRLGAVEFARLWAAYERDPASFFSDRKALVEIREPLTRFIAEQLVKHDQLSHRRQHLEEEMLFAKRRRELEFEAYDRELNLRTGQLQAQLTNETRALARQRRTALAAELRQARAEWQERKAREEEELTLLKTSFAEEQRQGREALELRAREVEHLKERALDASRRDAIAEQHAHARKLVEIEASRQRERYQARLAGIREEIARLRALEAKQRGERKSLRDADRRVAELLEALSQKESGLLDGLAKQRQEIETMSALLRTHTAEAADQGRRPAGFWSRPEKVVGDMTVRDLEREVRALEKAERAETERLAKFRDERAALELRKGISGNEVAEAENRLAAIEMRIQLYEDDLRTLLDSAGAERPAALADPALEEPEPSDQDHP